MKNMNVNFVIETLYVIYEGLQDEVRGKSFAELYPYGNDSIDMDLNFYIDVNGYRKTKTQEEIDEFINSVYEYVHE